MKKINYVGRLVCFLLFGILLSQCVNAEWRNGVWRPMSQWTQPNYLSFRDASVKNVDYVDLLGGVDARGYGYFPQFSFYYVPDRNDAHGSLGVQAYLGEGTTTYNGRVYKWSKSGRISLSIKNLVSFRESDDRYVFVVNGDAVYSESCLGRHGGACVWSPSRRVTGTIKLVFRKDNKLVYITGFDGTPDKFVISGVPYTIS